MVPRQARLEKPVYRRYTVVEKVSYQSTDGTTHQVSTASMRKLLGTVEEQHYERPRRIANAQWAELDLGWVESPAAIVIRNDVGRQPKTVIPSAEELEALADAVLEVTYDGLQDTEKKFLIYPSDSLRVCPTEAASLRIRSRNGSPVPYLICVIPS